MANVNFNVLCVAESFLPPDPHHPPLHINFKAALDWLNNKHKTNNVFYNFKRSDLIYLYQSIGGIDWSFLGEFVNVDDAFEVFYLHLYSLINQYVLVVKPSHRKYPPWLNSDLIKNIKKNTNVSTAINRTLIRHLLMNLKVLEAI